MGMIRVPTCLSVSLCLAQERHLVTCSLLTVIIVLSLFWERRSPRGLEHSGRTPGRKYFLCWAVRDGWAEGRASWCLWVEDGGQELPQPPQEGAPTQTGPQAGSEG